MGKQSRAKRERRQATALLATITACEGSWLEQPPNAEEQARIAAADRALRGFRLEAQELTANRAVLNEFSLHVFRDPRFQPLAFSDALIEMVLESCGEPPVATDVNDLEFTAYILRALGVIASARVRRALAEQSRRFLPAYVDEGKIREALVIAHNAYTTVMSEAASPLLVQMLIAGLARWYEESDEEDPEMAPPPSDEGARSDS